MITAPAQRHVVFAGGGTGGHVFPGLAVAQRLASGVPGMRITFAGTGKELERRWVGAAGFDYLALPCRPWPGRVRGTLRFLLDYLAGCRAAARFLDHARVDVVVGLGGYASVPMARAAARRRLPLVLLEQNAVPGRATRWLARSATLVCTSFQQAHRHLPSRCHFRVTGNPIRAGFCPAPTATTAQRPNGRTRQLLVLGGSGGAESLNQNVPKALDAIRPALSGWRVLHQSGQAQFEPTRRHYARLGLWAEVVPFVANMPQTLPRCDLAICRAGGTTLAELAAAGVPALLLPYAHAADDHQRANAAVFAAAGAAALLDEREAHASLDARLAEALRPLLADVTARAAMSAAMGRLALPDAAHDVAALIRQLAR